MSNHSVAEASAPSSRISTQGTTTTTSQPAANNSRGPELKGNTYAKKLIRDLDEDDRDKLVKPVLKALEKDEHLEDYFLDPLYNLFAEGDAREVYMHKLFVKSLMLMALKPKNAKLLRKTFGKDGHKYFEKLYSFFDSLEDDDVEKWADYISLSKYSGNLTIGQVQDMAKAYTPTRTPGTEILFNLNKIVHQPLVLNPEDNTDFRFKDDEELVAALDRYFPGSNWPASKLEIASDSKMRSRLEGLEARRIERESELAEAKKAREIRSYINATLIMGPNSLGRTDDPLYDVTTGMRRPEDAEPAADALLAEAKIKASLAEAEAEKRAKAAVKSGSQTVKKPVQSIGKKPTSKPTTSKKKV